MFEMYGYEYVRRANEERRERSLLWLARHRRAPEDSYLPFAGEAEIVELTFRSGCAAEEMTA